MSRSHSRLGGIWVAAWLAVTLPATWLPAGSWADEPNRAGLVILYGDGRVDTRCIDLPTEPITGADLLNRSGLAVVIDSSSGLGITVCQIEGQGCPYPAEPCFCQCMGGAGCAYWNYFYRDPGQATWSYSALGAMLREPRPGSVEAWVWGDGSTPPSADLTWEAVCEPTTAAPATPELTAEASGTATVTSSPAAGAADALAATSMPPAGATDTPTGVSAIAGRATPVPAGLDAETTVPAPASPAPTAPVGGRANVADYWPFALLVVGLALLALVVRRRR